MGLKVIQTAPAGAWDRRDMPYRQMSCLSGVGQNGQRRTCPTLSGLSRQPDSQHPAKHNESEQSTDAHASDCAAGQGRAASMQCPSIGADVELDPPSVGDGGGFYARGSGNYRGNLDPRRALRPCIRLRIGQSLLPLAPPGSALPHAGPWPALVRTGRGGISPSPHPCRYRGGPVSNFFPPLVLAFVSP